MTPTDWLASRGHTPFPFQQEVWRLMAEGASGLLHATTGSGKTYAVWLGALAALAGAGDAGDATGASAPASPAARKSAKSRQAATLSEAIAATAHAASPATPPPTSPNTPPAASPALPTTRARAATRRQAPPLTALWITPMRALAGDTEAALRAPLADLAPHWTLERRTGDTSSADRARQAERLPTALVTTPESLSLLLSHERAAERLGQVQLVVVDEWHELLGNKRGVQVQLALARLRRWNPGLRVWGLSATLGDLGHARDVLTGAQGKLVQGALPKALSIDTLLPEAVERFPWAGHLGMAMREAVIAEIERSRTTLAFTNTRSQAELWYQALLEARPDWAGLIALHHGSLDKSVREWVEAGLKTGSLKAVVATSSLDLGVDFSPVERVLQIGSAKGVARLLQRAGRSGHAPGQPSRLTLVPTHSLEIIEAAAAQRAVAAGRIETVRSPDKPFDVLVQHVVTVALGGGFHADALYDEVRGTAAFAQLTPDEWAWVLDFAGRGGEALKAYPDYKRIEQDEAGLWRVMHPQLARRHRLGIGTIVSDASVRIEWQRGGVLGHVEESFVARMRAGDVFLFAGRMLELVRIHNMVAQVKVATSSRGAVPRWNGGKMPLSSTLADAMQEVLAQAGSALDAAGADDDGSPAPAGLPPELSPELRAAWPLLQIQHRWSALPRPGSVLVERLRSREGHHLYIYPFAGRQVHLSLATLWAWRLSAGQPGTWSIAVNDYGLELMARRELPEDELREALPRLLSDEHLLPDVLASLNAAELSRRRFREIARIAGLVFTGYPGQPKSMKQLQASSSLFFDVFRQYDPHNLLLTQAEREVLRQEFELDRLEHALQRLRASSWQILTLRRFSPLSFPLLVERLREQLTTEKLQDRLKRLLDELHAAADAGGPGAADSDAALPADEPLPVEAAADAGPPGRRRRVRRRYF